MSTSCPEPICRHSFDTQELVESYPPGLHNRNKEIVYSIACPTGCTHAGRIGFSRWPKMPLPHAVSLEDHGTAFEVREDLFGYERAPEGSHDVEWYLNFAHHDLFCAYGGSLFAQDEMQVAEHPALASLREALLAKGIAPWTVENGEPTPVLITGVERRCEVATDSNVEEGRPFGLYGNEFADADVNAIRQATVAIAPPTVTNLIAMEAPEYGEGQYRLEEIEYILTTAYTGFAAAKFESCRLEPRDVAVVIHTGFWGCGAYGGNRVLMALLQVMAACLAGIDKLVFHTHMPSGSIAFNEAQRILKGDPAFAESEIEVPVLIGHVRALGFQWGVSDGN